jgi:hypothetical protein
LLLNSAAGARCSIRKSIVEKELGGSVGRGQHENEGGDEENQLGNPRKSHDDRLSLKTDCRIWLAISSHHLSAKI